MNRQLATAASLRQVLEIAGLSGDADWDDPETLRKIAGACQDRAKSIEQLDFWGRPRTTEFWAQAHQTHLSNAQHDYLLFHEFHQLTEGAEGEKLSKRKACRKIAQDMFPREQGERESTYGRRLDNAAERLRKKIAYEQKDGRYYDLLVRLLN